MPDTSSMTEPEARAVFESGFRQLHECLESHRNETRGAFKTLTGKLGELATSMDIGNAYNAALAKRMNIRLDVKEDGAVHGVEKVKAAVGAWTWKKLAVTVLPLVGGIVITAQLLIPAATAAAVAFYHALMNTQG